MISIREAIPNDLNELVTLNDEVHEYHRQAREDVFKEASLGSSQRHMTNYMSSSRATTFVAESAGKLVGYVQVEIKEVPEGDFHKQNRQGLVNSLAVTEGHKRTGIGKKLVERAETWLREQGIRHALLNVWEFNQSAIRFYESLGYQNYSRKMFRDL